MSKKIIALFLVFSVLSLSVNLFAKEGKGADLVVQKLDGHQIKGELIAVKENSLLLLDSEGADITVNISEIKMIIIDKKSAAKWGFLGGFLIGGGLAAWVVPRVSEIEGEEGLDYVLIGGLAFGGLLGLITGIRTSDERIKLEGKSDSEIKEILEDLRKKARVPEFQ